jgi:hypothetical protein
LLTCNSYVSFDGLRPKACRGFAERGLLRFFPISRSNSVLNAGIEPAVFEAVQSPQQ